MSEKRALGSMEKTNLGASVSFDLDEAPEPKRRTRKKENEIIDDPDDDITQCPGCGAEITHDEWLDALVGFVSGAHAYTNGSAVMARIVQTLRNEVSRMRVPQPTDEWELEVVERLTNEIAKIVQAEVNRVGMEQQETDVDLIREQATIQAEAELAPLIEAQLRQQMEEEVIPVLEAQIRQQVEAELWEQFESAWRERSSQE